MQFYRKTILNIEIRIDNINSVYFSFLFFIIQAIAIKQSEIVTYNIIHYKLKQYTKYQEKKTRLLLTSSYLYPTLILQYKSC